MEDELIFVIVNLIKLMESRIKLLHNVLLLLAGTVEIQIYLHQSKIVFFSLQMDRNSLTNTRNRPISSASLTSASLSL